MVAQLPTYRSATKHRAAGSAASLLHKSQSAPSAQAHPTAHASATPSLVWVADGVGGQLVAQGVGLQHGIAVAPAVGEPANGRMAGQAFSQVAL